MDFKLWGKYDQYEEAGRKIQTLLNLQISLSELKTASGTFAQNSIGTYLPELVQNLNSAVVMMESGAVGWEGESQVACSEAMVSILSQAEDLWLDFQAACDDINQIITEERLKYARKQEELMNEFSLLDSVAFGADAYVEGAKSAIGDLFKG